MNRRSLAFALVLLASACKPKETAAPPSKPDPTTTKPESPPADPVAAFWTWFVANAAALHASSPIDTMNKVTDHLLTIDPGVIAEIGGDQGDRTLVITADGKKDRFPMVEKIVAAKPAAPIPGWKVVAFRQRSNGELPVIEMKSTKISLAATKFVAEQAGDKLELTVYLDGPDDEDTRARIGFIALDHTVGEYDMETRIGGLEFAPIAKAPASARPIAELPAVVDALKK